MAPPRTQYLQPEVGLTYEYDQILTSGGGKPNVW
jgi:hypothetical protein